MTVRAGDDTLVRVATAARTSYGRLLAMLASATHDLASAEDALADAFERALTTWPERGVPDKPDAWLLTVARNRMRDRWRSAEATRTRPLDPVADDHGRLDVADPDALPDERLGLMLACAHPAIGVADRTPLMLNVVLGFTAAQIARAYAVPTPTMATRLTRAKRRIRDNRVPLTVPGLEVLRDRMPGLLEAVYGAYVMTWSGSDPQARTLPPEALQLVEILAELVPDDPEVRGLAALIELSTARRAGRLTADGSYVPLDRQDPGQWDGRLIARAHEHLRAAHARGTLGRFQLEAAIQSVHVASAQHGTSADGTLRSLYEALVTVAPSHGSLVALAAVVGRIDGPDAGLTLLDASPSGLDRFQPSWAVRADLLATAGRPDEARAAYERAVALSQDPAERRWLTERAAGLA